MPEKSVLVVFAGPNGSGKSTLVARYASLQALPKNYINADDITKELLKNQGFASFQSVDAETLYKINIFAANEAERLRHCCLQAGKSFATETVMSTPSKVNFMRQAKAQGFHIHLEFMNTQTPRINIGRVQSRVELGGHDVERAKIIARYQRSNYLLPEALQVADTAKVYNNSFEDPMLILEKNLQGEIRLHPLNPPKEQSKWTLEALLGLKEETMTMERMFRELEVALPVSKLRKNTAAEKVYRAYAKAVMAQNNGFYMSYDTDNVYTIESSTDGKIYLAMVEDGFLPRRIESVLAKSPALIGRPEAVKQLKSLLAVMKSSTKY